MSPWAAAILADVGLSDPAENEPGQSQLTSRESKSGARGG